MSDGDRGPSWSDLAAYAEDVRERWHVSTSFTFVPPVRRLDGKGKSAWSVGVHLCGHSQNQGLRAGGTRSWGYGGSFKSATAAAYAALGDAEEKLEEAQRAAASQARF